MSGNKLIEIKKLKQILQINEDADFDFLEQIDAENLKNLRLKIAQVIDLEQADIWQRIGKVAGFMPNFLNAKVAETVLGPLISANLANHVPIKDSVAILKNLSTKFLAEVAEYMIPEKSVQLIDNIPIDILKKVTSKLIENKKYFIASNFVGALPVQRIVTISDAIKSDLDLILISEYVENKSLIAKIVEGFDDDKILSIIKTAYTEEKQTEILNVFVLLPKKQLDRVIRLVRNLPLSIQELILNDFKQKLDE